MVGLVSGNGEQFHLVRQDIGLRPLRVRDIQQLDLPDHRLGAAGVKAAARPRQLGCVAHRATTDGSSITIGISTSRPLTTKLAPIPSGSV